MSDAVKAGKPDNATPTASRGEDKPTEAGASSSQEFRQKHLRAEATTSATNTAASILPTQPHELTAEWTVRAKLTFARTGEKVQREFSSNDPVNPVSVVYKWSTIDSPLPPDDDADIDSSSSIFNKGNSFASRGSRQSTPLKYACRRSQQPNESFRSTTSSVNADCGGGDSAFSGSNASKQRQRPYQRQNQAADNGPNVTAALYGTRCHSTCNIVVSAVADFLSPEAATATTIAADDFSSVCVSGEGTATHVTATPTDFVPEEGANPILCNTTTAYAVSPQKSIDSTLIPGSKNFTAFDKILALRDAFSQTSDTETKYFEEREREFERRRYASKRSPIEWRGGNQQQPQQRKSYDHRRATTEGILPDSSSRNADDFYVDEGNSLMPSYLMSLSHASSASLPRIPSLPEQACPQQQHTHPSQRKSNSSEPLKKPRTVHIDVYCTGSEDEEEEGEDDEGGAHADAEASVSSDDDASKRQDLESTSTPQTVFNNEELLLRHQRITSQTLPRRLQQQQQRNQNQKLTSAEQCTEYHQTAQLSSVLNLGHAIIKSSTAEEVSESKQLLFRKHIGDQRAAKLALLRQKYMRQPSDDAVSSNYPNSSRSTVRDGTCSSIASSVLTSPHVDYGDSCWKETDDQMDLYSLAKSDSFEYENKTDRLRIKQMEHFWSRSSSAEETSGQRHKLSVSPVSGHIQSPSLQPISEISSQRNSPFSTPVSRHDVLPSESEMVSDSSDVVGTYQHDPPLQSQLKCSTEMDTSKPPSLSSYTPAYLQESSHYLRNRPGFLQFFGPSPTLNSQHSPTQELPTFVTATPPQVQLFSPDYQPNMQRWKSETRDNLSTHGTSSPIERSTCTSPQSLSDVNSRSYQRCGSEALCLTIATAAADANESPIVARRLELKIESPPLYETPTIYSGYTTEHLQKAKKFGNVVRTVRKPGHHVGPTKNPNCTCESCQRWLAERFKVRGRAFSLGERPVLKRPTRGET